MTNTRDGERRHSTTTCLKKKKTKLWLSIHQESTREKKTCKGLYDAIQFFQHESLRFFLLLKKIRNKNKNNELTSSVRDVDSTGSMIEGLSFLKLLCFVMLDINLIFKTKMEFNFAKMFYLFINGRRDIFYYGYETHTLWNTFTSIWCCFPVRVQHKFRVEFIVGNMLMRLRVDDSRRFVDTPFAHTGR